MVSRVVQYCMDTLSQQRCTMLHGHPWSAGLYNAAGTLSVSRVVQCCRVHLFPVLHSAPSVNRVVQCCGDTLSQQGCMMLQDAPLPSAALSTLSTPGCIVLQGHPQSAGLYDAAQTLSQQGCMMLHRHSVSRVV